MFIKCVKKGNLKKYKNTYESYIFIKVCLPLGEDFFFIINYISP